jgi:release factor glutamine methyltransferase
MSATTPRDWLHRARAHWPNIPVGERRRLLAHALGWRQTELIARETDALAAEGLAAGPVFEQLIGRRARGEPIAYLLGEKEFYGRAFAVSPAALIPRPETEELVEQALLWLHHRSASTSPLRVLDVGTGSGVIAITLALEHPGLDVWALDISVDALGCARRNAIDLQAPVHFLQSDYLTGLATDECFDLIVANPPYIAAADPHLEQGDLRFEPATALSDGHDGLQAYRCLSMQAPAHLRPGGCILVEHGHTQQGDILSLFERAGFTGITGLTDLAGKARMVRATRG